MEELLKQISENPDSIAEFTAEQVEEAREGLKGFMAQVKEGEIKATKEDLAEVAALNVKLVERQSALEEEQAEYDAALAEIEKSLGIEEEAEEPETEVEPEVEPATETEDEPILVEADDSDEKVVVTAAVQMGGVAKRIPKERKPREEGPALVASADSKAPGERITDPRRLGELSLERHRSLGNNKPAAGQTFHSVAKFSAQSEFVIDDPGSEEKGHAVMEAVAKKAREEATSDPESLTAALAFCAPAQPIYEQFGSISRSGLLTLPTVTATRGRVTYPTSLSYQSLTGDDGLGVSGIGTNWTGSGNKSVYTFVCPENVTCEVEAFVTIIQVNNAPARFYPEAIADLNAKALATAAQSVNIQLIADLLGNSKVNTLQGEDTGAGAIINFVNNIAFHASEYREKFRLPIDSVLDAVVPHWVFEALFTDAFARDSTNELGGVRARVRSMLADLNVRAQFIYGWQDIAPDLFGTFPAAVDVLLWEPGTVVRLDSGTLDLGVVRDSTLNATNDFQTFVETFEAVCVPGHEVLLINDIPICPNGETGQRVAINCGATPS